MGKREEYEQACEDADREYDRLAREWNEAMYEHDNALPGQTRDRIKEKMIRLSEQMEAARAREKEARRNLSKL